MEHAVLEDLQPHSDSLIETLHIYLAATLHVMLVFVAKSDGVRQSLRGPGREATG